MEFVSLASALWLGILTSVSPCPLASNIAAVSYIVHETGGTSSVLTTGIIYTLGRVCTYAVLGILISMSILNIPLLSQFLQNVIPKFIGPVLILTGLFLLQVIKFSFSGVSFSGKTVSRFKGAGLLGAFPLGILFALAFCPVSAALFFGSLIPLSVANSSPVVLPLVYGFGTGLPVLAFAFAFAVGLKNINRLFHGVTRIEYWVRKATAIVMILAGIYYVMAHIFYINIL